MSLVLQKQLEKPSSKFLVFTSAGRHANCSTWIKGRRNFDLWVTNYSGGDEGLLNLADYYAERKGGKFPNLHAAFHQWPEIFEKYDAIFVSDDDLYISAGKISELFEILFEFDLDVLQPAFSQFGKWSHKFTRAKLLSYLRYCNFVEVTCPLFRMSKLAEFMAVYDPVLVGWGTDHWFMQTLVGDAPNKAAIVDAIVAINPFDEVKGRREIHTLQVDTVRHATWKEIQRTRNVSEVNPLREWGKVQRWARFRFYSGTVVTAWTKLWVRIRVIFGVDPSQRIPDDDTDYS
jgi:hypothetical protein